MVLQNSTEADNASNDVADARSADDAVRTSLPRITVITPAYNVAPYIGEAVESVLRQTFREFEYLVVDDGSTDKTVEEVHRLMQGDSRLRLIKAGHGGSASARNIGLRQARGEFIAFLDGDDRWHPSFLQSQLALLESVGPNVAAVFARSRVISQNGRLYAFRWQPSGRCDFDDMLIRACPPRCGSSLLIRKSCFDLVGEFSDEIFTPDHSMWLRIQRDSGMPYFWGNAAYLLDLRVRAGAISRDHRGRFEKCDAIAREFSPGLRRYPASMAYVRFAVFAFRAGYEDYASRWAQQAKQAGLAHLLVDSYGWRLLGWTVLPPIARRALRRGNSLARTLLGRIISAPAGLLR
jgi:glycosyltransferase involved in cell wall biosynthesis